MDAATRALLRERADNRCEYCLPRQQYCEFTHHIEHIVSKQYCGRDAIDDLALACHRCNLKKGPNLTGVGPITGEFAPLFRPRRNRWEEHFAFQNTKIEGLTPTGRATVQLLAMNDARRLELRSELLARGGLD
jgi:5-methylcytosine-specific restriction endonuclease McrA